VHAGRSPGLQALLAQRLVFLPWAAAFSSIRLCRGYLGPTSFSTSPGMRTGWWATVRRSLPACPVCAQWSAGPRRPLPPPSAWSCERHGQAA